LGRLPSHLIFHFSFSRHVTSQVVSSFAPPLRAPFVVCPMMKRGVSMFGRVLVAGALVMLATGCQTYDRRAAGFTQATQRGDIAAAVRQADRQAEAGQGTKDEILLRLEQGQTWLTAAVAGTVPGAATADGAATQGLQRAVAAFDQAEAKVNAYEEAARVRVGSEIGALVTNQASLPYRGRAYDKVMMNTYKAVAYLALGEKDKARVELNRALQRQRDAVAANAKRIAAAQTEAEQGRQGALRDGNGRAAAYDADQAMGDARTGPALQATLDASVVALKPYGDYVNPFAVFLDGLFFTVLGEDGSDRERGRKSFERVAALVPENDYLRADLAAARQAAEEGRAVTGVTYVIFETGAAPARAEARVDIPTYLASRRLSYVGASFPKLVYHGDYVDRLDITAGGRTQRTALVASMDGVIANDFKNEWPAVVTKTLLSAATKAIAQAALQKELNERTGELGGLLVWPWAWLMRSPPSPTRAPGRRCPRSSSMRVWTRRPTAC
jgi:uncharacterized protein